jgi:hypothetical protein
MVQNDPAKKKKKVMRVQKYAFLAVKTEKTAKNRPRGSFSEEKNFIPLANKRSYPDFVSLRSPNSHSFTSRQPDADAFNILWV